MTKYIVFLFVLSQCPLLHAQLDWKERQISVADSDIDQETKLVAVTYVCTNVGTYAVNIVNMKSSCGCTKPTVDKSKIKPGESAEVDVSFDTRGRHGFQKKQIIVQTDDMTENNVMLTLKCTLPETVKVSPGRLRWKVGSPNEVQEVSINFDSGAPASIYSAVSTNELFFPVLSFDKDKNCYLVKVTPSQTTEMAKATIRVETNNSERPFLYIYCEISPELPHSDNL